MIALLGNLVTVIVGFSMMIYAGGFTLVSLFKNCSGKCIAIDAE